MKVAWRFTVTKAVTTGTVEYSYTYTRDFSVGTTLYVCGRSINNWYLVSDTKDGANAALIFGGRCAIQEVITSGRQWREMTWAETTPHIGKTLTRTGRDKETYVPPPAPPSGSTSSRVQVNVLDHTRRLTPKPSGKGPSIDPPLNGALPQYMLIAYAGPDDLVISDGVEVGWAKTASFEVPTPIGKQIVFDVSHYKDLYPNKKVPVVGDPLPNLAAGMALYQQLNAAQPDEDLGFLGGFGAWMWAGIEGIGLMAYGANRLYVETVTMPLLRMFREPETWQYKVRLRKIDVGATAPAPPTLTDDGEAAAGYVESGGFGAAIASAGGASAGVAFSTLAFFSWPFRKWAGDEFVDEVDVVTGDRVANGVRGVWLTPVVDPVTGKDDKRVGTTAAGAPKDLPMLARVVAAPSGP
jgi:hypothetical protein